MSSTADIHKFRKYCKEQAMLLEKWFLIVSQCSLVDFLLVLHVVVRDLRNR
jgi:hypothetical protein